MTATRPPRLLIVDDETKHLRALCDTLRLDGYETTGFDRATKALEVLEPGAFDLLLADLQMPEVGGIELLTRAREIDPDLAGVIMTGHGTIDTAVAAMQGGAFDYILKPFKLTSLVAMLGRALDARRLRIEHAALQQRERQRAEELAAAYRHLESFSYSISHDLRAPLRAIDGFTRIFLEDHGAAVPPDGRELLDQVVQATARMDRMISALLNFSRYGSQPLNTVDVDIRTVTRRVVDSLLAQPREHPPEVVIGDLPPCRCDPALLEQVLTNLISNALKFTSRRTDARIEIDSFVQPGPGPGPGTERVYFVRDNGAGFDQAYAGKLFCVFQRLHAESDFEGTGVGLSIVQRIVERHGGRVWATGEPGHGATFFFTLPACG